MTLFTTRHLMIGVLMMFATCTGVAKSNTLPAAGQETVTPLMTKMLPELPGDQAMLVKVEFLPGQAAKPHEHPGSVFAYVLAGSITSQLAGQKNPITYHQGQYWYEPPYTGHLVCKNASDTQPAELLVWQLVPNNDPIVLPYSAK